MIFNVQDYSVKTNSKAVQTKELQKVFDLCKAQGGTIVFPKGEYYTGSLYVYANTTIHLEKGAVLYGSDNMDDFILYDIPAGMEVHTDKEVLPDGLFGNGPKYRCAVLNAYGEDNITIEGEGVTSIMNGLDVYDENGEEGFRGPHGVFFTHCDNIVIKNYVTARFGNFHYHFDCCHHIRVENMLFEAGHDGVHLHFCEDVEITNSALITGDDCVAGENIKDVHINNCDICTACNAFRIGGENIVIENCHIWGPCIYPHRMTIIKGKGDYLPETEGRHNLCAVIAYSSSTNFPSVVPSTITIKNCMIENPEELVGYNTHIYHMGKPFGNLTVKDSVLKGVSRTCHPIGSNIVDFEIVLDNVTYTMAETTTDTLLVDDSDKRVKLVIQ